MMYEFVHKYIHGLFKAGRFDKETFTYPKAQLYQMYVAIGRLDAEKFVALDFTLNFGISPAVRAAFVEAMQTGGEYEEVKATLLD